MCFPRWHRLKLSSLTNVHIVYKEFREDTVDPVSFPFIFAPIFSYFPHFDAFSLYFFFLNSSHFSCLIFPPCQSGR
jgi:hypothetical protein